MTTQAIKIDLNQGINKDGNKFGYAHGDEGGYFFDWMPTLEETLATVAADEVDGDGGLTVEEATEAIRAKIASKFDDAE